MMTFPSVLKSERGAAVIELALAAPILAVMTIGMVDLSNAYSRKLALEQGAQRAVEKIMQTTEDDTVENTLDNEVKCQVNGSTTTSGVTTCNTSATQTITVTWRRECTNSSGTRTNAPGSPYSTSANFDLVANACPAGTTREADYIEVAVTDKYTPMFPFRFAGFNADGTYHISATAGVRTS